jgi:predicted membrane chloride channel (bestrophin family)
MQNSDIDPQIAAIGDSDDSSSEVDVEQPLLKSPRGGRSYTFDHQTHSVKADLLSHGIVDNMNYNTRTLTTWEPFQITHTTVWSKKELWIMMLKLLLVTLCVCCITVAVVPNPAVMKVSKFTQVSKFLNVVVGLLLGFFLSSSMNRWYACVNGFLELLDAIRNLQMQFAALGVAEGHTILCLRYGLASAWLLYGQLACETKQGAEEIQEREFMWKKMEAKMARIDRTGQTRLLDHLEVEALKKTRDPPGMVWMWVAALIGRLAQDGEIPGMQSPTYGRVMNLCQNAHGGIRQVRAAVSVQAPLTYTHMLATLVHINNFLCAVILGLVSGLAIGTTLVAHKMHFFAPNAAQAKMRESDQDLQNMMVTFMYCFFGPVLYQALLFIGMSLAQPFGSNDAQVPMHRLLHCLEVDMCNGRDLMNYMPFEKPYFKDQPPLSATESEAHKHQFM